MAMHRPMQRDGSTSAGVYWCSHAIDAQSIAQKPATDSSTRTTPTLWHSSKTRQRAQEISAHQPFFARNFGFVHGAHARHARAPLPKLSAESSRRFTSPARSSSKSRRCVASAPTINSMA